MAAEIIGKIVRILSDREVVINRGLADGVGYDTEFVIYEEGDPVVDPESPEAPGRIEIVKDRAYGHSPAGSHLHSLAGPVGR